MASNEPKLRQRRARRYGPEVGKALRKMWKVFDGACEKRLKPLLEWEVGRLRDLGELRISDEIYGRLPELAHAGSGAPCVLIDKPRF